MKNRHSHCHRKLKFLVIRLSLNKTSLVFGSLECGLAVKRNIEKLPSTKKTTDAIDLAKEFYIQLGNELANRKTLFEITYEEEMKQYIAYKQREVDVNALTFNMDHSSGAA